MHAKTIAVLMASLVCVLGLHAHAAVTERTDVRQPAKGLIELVQVQQLVKQLRDCPAPIDIAQTNVARRSEVLRRLLSLCDYDLETIRAAESVIMENSSGLNEAKLYVFNRCLFDVPELVGRETPSFSGWQACYDSNGYRMLWPLAKGPDGTLVLEDMDGFYMGPTYRAVQEFEYFRRNFRLRKR